MIDRLKYYCERVQEILLEHRILASVKKYAHRDDTVILMGTPLHGNLGDQAITLAETDFFTEGGYRVVEIPSPMVARYLEKWKTLISGKRIYVHGGGFIGSLWPEEQKMLETVIENFKESEIVILAQTVYYDKVDSRTECLNGLFGSHGKVVLCARETYSYEFACQHLYNAKVKLVPDMVLSVNWFDKQVQKQDKVLFCMRNDLEKTISDDTVNLLRELVKKYYPTANIEFTDTVVDGMIYPYMRKAKLQKKLTELSLAQIVVTDRLHGMVLSAMTNTPTLVFGNCNYKVKGIYDWIDSHSFIQYCDDTTKLEEYFAALTQEKDCHYSCDQARTAFEPLVEIVGNCHG